MVHRALPWIVTGTVTVLVGCGSYWLHGFVSLALFTGLVWGVGVGILVRIYRLYPERATGTAWTDKRWTGLGTGLLGYQAAAMAEMERAPSMDTGATAGANGAD
jgi:hypothetical protein